MDWEEYMSSASCDEKLQFLIGLRQGFHKDDIEDLCGLVNQKMNFYYHGNRTLTDYNENIKPIMTRIFVDENTKTDIEKQALQEYKLFKKYISN